MFVSEESCPFCAAERWPLTVALSHFGTWSQLGVTKSAATDVYPDTATLSFRTAGYHSSQLTLRTTELADNAGHLLQVPTSLDRQLIGRYDVPPYVNSADQSGAVPFLDTRSPPDPPPRQHELGRGPQFGQVHAEPFPQAGLARLGHGDDAADLLAGDPAALEQAFVVLTAIIGAVDRRYVASLRRASGVRNVTRASGCRPRIAILCHEKVTCWSVRRIRNLFLTERV